MVPYRERAAQSEPHDQVESARGETSFAVAMWLFVAVSLIRVVGAVAEHETFGAEASLAFLVVLVGLASTGHAVVRAVDRWRRG